MEVHFPLDVQTRLQQVASANGMDAQQLVNDPVARTRFVAGVQRGVEQAVQGEFVEHQDVVDRINRLLHP